MKLFNFFFRTSPGGLPTFAIPFSDSVMSRALAAGVAETITVPAGASIVVFSSNCDFYVKADGVAAVPGDVTDGSASALNPSVRDVSAVSEISVISAEGGIVTAEFFA